MRILQTAWDKVDIYTHVAKRCKVLAKVTYLLLLVVSLATTVLIVSTRAAKGCFNVTSTRVFSDQFCQKKHLPDENLRRDDHSSKNELKRVETGRDMSLES